jgi:hypothetical protein
MEEEDEEIRIERQLRAWRKVLKDHPLVEK